MERGLLLLDLERIIIILSYVISQGGPDISQGYLSLSLRGPVITLRYSRNNTTGYTTGYIGAKLKTTGDTLIASEKLNSTNGPTRFRDPRGCLITAGLFRESTSTSDNPPYNLKDLKRAYLEMEDLTEFEFATEYFEDFAHWELLCKTIFFKPHAEQWRKELALKIKARSLRGIIRDAVKDNKYEANKFLITNGWIDKDNEGKKVRGRPSKEEIKEELHRQATTEKELLDDLNRIKDLN